MTDAGGTPRDLLLAGTLFDDAAVFPPGDAPVDAALAQHRDYRSGPPAPYVGPLVVADRHLDALAPLLRDGAPLAVALVVPGGVGDVGATVRRAASIGGLDVVAVEAPVAPPGPAPAPGPVAGAAAALRDAVPPGATPYLELAWHDGLPGDVAGAAAAGVRVKLRTGGASASAFPTPAALRAAVDACLRHGVPFKCTAGLHNAVAHTDAATGFEHHGFLNVVLAAAGVAGALELRDPAEVARRVEELPDAALAAARAAFVSLGTCSVLEGVADLTALGLLPPAATSPAAALSGATVGGSA